MHLDEFEQQIKSGFPFVLLGKKLEFKRRVSPPVLLFPNCRMCCSEVFSSFSAFGIKVCESGMLAYMRHGAQSERDALLSNLLEALKNSLENLNHLRLISPNDAHVLGLKQHLRDKIRELEHDQSHKEAA